MSNLIKVRKCDLGSISKTFLGMLTRNRNISSLEPPPIRKPFAVIETRVSAPSSLFPTINITVFSHRDPNLEGVTIDLKLTFHSFPGTRVIFVLHPVPILAFLVKWPCVLSDKSPHVNGRLTMDTTSSVRTRFWTPFTVVSHIVNVPLEKGEVLLNGRKLVWESSLKGQVLKVNAAICPYE